MMLCVFYDVDINMCYDVDRYDMSYSIFNIQCIVNDAIMMQRLMLILLLLMDFSCRCVCLRCFMYLMF